MPPSDDGLAVAEQPVGEHAAEERRGVHQRGVAAVDGVGRVVGEQEVLRHVVDEQRPHTVVAEALPHLGEEEDVQPLRMALLHFHSLALSSALARGQTSACEAEPLGSGSLDQRGPIENGFSPAGTTIRPESKPRQDTLRSLHYAERVRFTTIAFESVMRLPPWVLRALSGGRTERDGQLLDAQSQLFVALANRVGGRDTSELSVREAR